MQHTAMITYASGKTLPAYAAPPLASASTAMHSGISPRLAKKKKSATGRSSLRTSARVAPSWYTEKR